jgi:hypothetical protein
METNQKINEITNALKVIAYTNHIFNYLRRTDPMALDQVLNALDMKVSIAVFYSRTQYFRKWNAENDDERVPTRNEFIEEFARVYLGNDLHGVTPDKYFEELNINPEKYIKDLPKDVRHMSMSVGDIIAIGKDYYQCGRIGWNQIEFFSNFTEVGETTPR